MTRGWCDALMGSGAAVLALLMVVLLVGSALTQVPLHDMQLLVGALLLLFGMRWLRKAILRAAGALQRRDEAAKYHRQVETLQGLHATARGWDKLAFVTAFKITMLEGIEVVFIVIAIGAGGSGLLLPAGVGTIAALIVVVALGVAVRRPLERIPENTLKFAVGVLLTAFGTFWVGEGMGFAWPDQDLSIPGLIAGYLIVARLGVRQCRRRVAAATRREVT